MHSAGPPASARMPLTESTGTIKMEHRPRGHSPYMAGFSNNGRDRARGGTPTLERSLAMRRAGPHLPSLGIFLAFLAASCAGNQPGDRHPGPAEAPPGPDNKQLWWVPIDVGGEQSLLETAVYRPAG